MGNTMKDGVVTGDVIYPEELEEPKMSAIDRLRSLVSDIGFLKDPIKRRNELDELMDEIDGIEKEEIEEIPFAERDFATEIEQLQYLEQEQRIKALINDSTFE